MKTEEIEGMYRRVTGKDLPQIGQKIYIPTSLYLGHGRDDFAGGLCKICRIQFGISGGEKTIFITVEERPNCQYNWDYIRKNQEKWREKYKGCVGHPDPDFRREFNEW